MINLKELRKASGKNQSEIARLLGVTQQTYANYENGRTEASYDTLVRISKVFNLTVDEVISKNGGTDTINANPLVRLIELRNKNNLTQKDIAKITGYQQTLVSKWENGEREPDSKTLIKLAKYFNVTVDYLVGYDGAVEESAPVPQYTAQQKNCIDEISSLSDIECMQVLTFIKTMKQVKKEADLETLRILKLNDNN